MKIEEILTIISNIESRFAVDEWEIDGIKIWPFIRIQNYVLLSNRILQSSVKNTRSADYIKKIISSKFKKIVAEYSDRKMNAEITQADIVLLGDGVTYTKLSNLWYEMFCDPIQKNYEKKNLTSIRLDRSHYFFTPRYSSSKFIQCALDNIVIYSLARNVVRSPIFENEKWADYDFFLNDPYVNEHLTFIPDKKKIRARVFKLRKLKQYYLRLLNSIQPKLAFVMCYYSDTSMAFLLACNEKNIKTIDMQHGVQGDLHLAYGNWNKVPLNGYSLLPDYFWVWSAEEKVTIDQWSENIKTHKPIIGGNLFAEFWKEDTNLLVKEYDQLFKSKTMTPGNPSILYTLSPGIDIDAFTESTWNVIKKTQNQYNWFIRLHPLMINDMDKIKSKLLKKGIQFYEIDICTQLPLFTVLRNVNLHITNQSSVVIEASEFGIKSIITSSYGASLYENVIAEKSAYLCIIEENIQSKIVDLFKKQNLSKKFIKKDTERVFNTFDNILKN